jgi:hypothetical protein
MSVVTPDFQWCATVDGKSSQGAFQSFQRGFADRVSGASVHAGTIELTDDGFVMTTEEDDLTPVSTVWHAFGHPQRVLKWIPQIYRRILGTSAAPLVTIPVLTQTATSSAWALQFQVSATTFSGFVLLENGDQIIIEDGTGFLLL